MDRTKTDTIIGIVGAVAIVFTLVGVFAYEYNNVPDDVDGGDGTPTEPGIPSETFSGSVESDDAATETFNPGEGVTAIAFTITWTPAAPEALADQAAGAYSWTLNGPDGTPVDNGSSTTSESFDVPAAEAGEYTLTITTDQASLGGDYTITAEYTY